MTRPRLEILPNELIRRRLESTLTRRELAEKVGITVSRIDQFENDTNPGIRPDTLRAISEALGCNPSDISQVVVPDEVAS
jgi:DNA-binding Xre family transcriptional regulator